MNRATVQRIRVFGLRGVQVIVNLVNERIGIQKDTGGGKNQEHAFVSNFLAKHAASRRVQPAGSVRVGNGFNQFVGEHIVR